MSGARAKEAARDEKKLLERKTNVGGYVVRGPGRGADGAYTMNG